MKVNRMSILYFFDVFKIIELIPIYISNNLPIIRKRNTIIPASNSSGKKEMYTGGDFADVVTGSSIYVDKSLFVKEIIEDSSKVILITMPRRWGKSLNLDTLKRFLSIEEQNEWMGHSSDPEIQPFLKKYILRYLYL